MDTNEIPELPAIFHQGHITEEGAKALLNWKAAIEKLPRCGVHFEETAGGAVKISDGEVMQVLFNVMPEGMDSSSSDSPYGEARFDLYNKASIGMQVGTSDFDDWFEKLKEAGSPIGEEFRNGTWEEVYNLLVKFVEFREKKMVPPFPENLQ